MCRLKKKLAQKLLSVVVSLSLLAVMVPWGDWNSVVEAELPMPIEISQEMFIMKDELQKVCAETNGGTGLLATGTESDRVIRIVFGNRPNPVKYFYKDWGTTHEKPAGPMTWTVIGWDEAPNSGKPGLVLMPEGALISANTTENLFQESTSMQVYNAPADTGYGGETTSQTVNPNHWGASNIRKQLQTIEANPNWFSTKNQAMMLPSTVITLDKKNNLDYKTTDILYAALSPGNNNYGAATITVGEADGLMIDKSHWSSRSWLRSPHLGNKEFATYTRPGEGVNNASVDYPNTAVAAAFKLNLGTVIFSSAAAASKNGSENFTLIPSATPMVLRLDGTAELSRANVTANGKKLTYTVPAGSRLMVIATAEDGATYQFSHNVDTEVADETLDLADFAGDLLGQNITAKAWIEKDVEDSGTLTYSTAPINIATMIRKETNAGYFTFTPPENLTYDGEPKEATVTVKPGITGMGEITIHYYDSDGNLLDSPPFNAGKYTVKIDVAEGSHYTAATGLTDESWAFEITEVPQRPVERPETPSEDNQDDGINVLIADVDVNSQTQRVMVRGPYKVLPRGTKLVVEVAPPHEELDDQGYEIEQQTHYNIWLLNEDGTSLPMPLPEKVELLFQILKNGNGDDLEIVLVTEGEDIQFEENTVGIDGIRYRRAYTDHFSPYSLLDKLTEEEKNALNAVKTGDELTYVTISGLGLVMTLALGLMLNSKINRKKSDM